MQASVVGTGTVTASLHEEVAMQASVAGAGSVTANLQRVALLQAAVNGIGSVTATLRETVSMKAAVNGVGSVVADLTVTVGGGATVLMQAVVQATSAVFAYLGGLLGTRTQMPNRLQEWSSPIREESGKTHTATVVGAGGTANAALECDGYTSLLLLARLTGAADADLALTVRPYEDDGTTVFDFVLTPVAAESSGPTHAGGVVRRIAVYNIYGLAKVEVRVVNNNAGSQTANVVYHLRTV